MFGWFRKKPEQFAAKGVTKKEMRKASKIGPNPIKELEAEGYTYRGTLADEGPMKDTIIMEKKYSPKAKP